VRGICARGSWESERISDATINLITVGLYAGFWSFRGLELRVQAL